MKKLNYLMLSIFCFAISCQPDTAIQTESEQSLENAGNARVGAAAGFASRVRLGTVQDSDLDEISGVAASRRNPGLLWVHEDSGNEREIYLINEQGSTRATIELPSSVDNRDWEDIAVGPGPVANTWYIYLADFGDNGASNSSFSVYRFIEPSMEGRSLPFNGSLSSSAVERLEFRYNDGARNAETLMIHAQTRDLYIITKEDGSSRESTKYSVKGGIYRAAYPQRTSAPSTLVRSGNANVSTATGGDISPDGTEVLIKNYPTVYLWKKSFSSQSITQLLQSSRTTTPYTEEPGGEAICWKSDGSGYYTISEIKNNIPAAIYFYRRQ